MKEERERDRIRRNKEEGDIMRGITFIVIIVMKWKMFTALKVPRQCQLVLLVKVGCKMV